RAGARVEFGGDRREETPARKDPALDVRQERIGQGPEPLRARVRPRRRLEHFTFKNRGRRLDRRQLEVFLGFEVRIEAALAHPDLGGQVADRQAVQSPHGRQLRGGVQNGGATGLAFGGAGLVASRGGSWGRGSVHDLTIARTVVIIKRGKSPRGRTLRAIPYARERYMLADTASRAAARPFRAGRGPPPH